MQPTLPSRLCEGSFLAPLVLPLLMGSAKSRIGALSMVIFTILSHLILKEKLSLFGWIVSCWCILGTSLVALNGLEEQSVTTIAAFNKLVLAPGL